MITFRNIYCIMFLSPGHHNRAFLWLLCAYGTNGRGQACVDTATPGKFNLKLMMFVITVPRIQYLLYRLHVLDFRSHHTKCLDRYFRSLERRQSQVPTGFLTQMSFPVNSTPRQRPSSSTPPTILLGRRVYVSRRSFPSSHFLVCTVRPLFMF